MSKFTSRLSTVDMVQIYPHLSTGGSDFKVTIGQINSYEILVNVVLYKEAFWYFLNYPTTNSINDV